MPELTSTPLVLLAVAALSYLLGSVPFGIVVTRVMGLGDIRRIGSGNIGATNVLRTGNRLAAALTLLLDAGKGAIAVIAARLLVGEDAAQVAAVFAFLGHLWPAWLGFRGGKGVSTFLGTILALHWPLGLMACATWVAMAALSRISSLSGLAAAALTPLYAALFGGGELVAMSILLVLLIFLRHHENISRLLAGTEPRIGGKKNSG
jgi:acyl phosphate:glycerol-3-phosphate acyltransferase